LIGRDSVTAPIANATCVKQVASFARAATLVLSESNQMKLDESSRI